MRDQKTNFIKANKGFTLIEIIITLAIAVVVTVFAFSVHRFALVTSAQGKSQSDVQFDARMTADFITREVRFASQVEILATASSIPDPVTTEDCYIYRDAGNIIYQDQSGKRIIASFSSVNLTFTSATGKLLKFEVAGTYNGKAFSLNSEVLPLNMSDVDKIINTSGVAVRFNQNNSSSNNTLYIHPTPPNAYAGSPYSSTFSNLVAGTYNYVLISGSLPPGLTLTPSGSILGTPTTPGNYIFKVKETDSSTPQQYGTRTFAILIGHPGVLASDILSMLGEIPQPASGATSLVLPAIPSEYPEFAVVIANTSNPGVVTTNGTIIPSGADTNVTLTLKVFSLINASDYATVDKTVTIPAGSGNHAPTATNVVISGTPKIGQTLMGGYNYLDDENDGQAGTTFQWYRGSSLDGTDKTAVSGATAQTYVCTPADEDQYLFFEVTPRAGAGTPTGVSVLSAPVQVSANVSPKALNVKIVDRDSGAEISTAGRGQFIRGIYTYVDEEGDIESGTILQWKITNKPGGNLNSTGNGQDYQVQNNDTGKYLYFEVIPKAATGPTTGAPAISAYVYVNR